MYGGYRNIPQQQKSAFLQIEVFDLDLWAPLRRSRALRCLRGVILPKSQDLLRMEVQVQGVNPVKSWSGTGWIPTHHCMHGRGAVADQQRRVDDAPRVGSA
jgi:hypothetical protein